MNTLSVDCQAFTESESRLIYQLAIQLLAMEWLNTRPSRTPKKDVLFIIGDWNAKVGSQETSGKFGLGVRKEAGQRLTEFCQENALVIANIFFPTTQEKTLHMDITRWQTPKSN